jgi:hypothetical protein
MSRCREAAKHGGGSKKSPHNDSPFCYTIAPKCERSPGHRSRLATVGICKEDQFPSLNLIAQGLPIPLIWLSSNFMPHTIVLKTARLVNGNEWALLMAVMDSGF